MVSDLRRAVTGRKDWKGLLAVGREVLVDQLDGKTEGTKPTALARRAVVERHYVAGYLRTLGRIAPLLFPTLADDVGRAIAEEFEERRDDWTAELRQIDSLGEDDEHFFLGRELRACRFRRPPEAMPSVEELARRTGVDVDRVAEILPEARNEETGRRLEVECRRERVELFTGVARLREAFSGPLLDVAGELAVGNIRGEEPTGEDIELATGIPAGTVNVYKRRARGRVAGLFPAAGTYRGRGRKGKGAA
jgi:hypothetical protein